MGQLPRAAAASPGHVATSRQAACQSLIGEACELVLSLTVVRGGAGRGSRGQSRRRRSRRS